MMHFPSVQRVCFSPGLPEKDRPGDLMKIISKFENLMISRFF